MRTLPPQPADCTGGTLFVAPMSLASSALKMKAADTSSKEVVQLLAQVASSGGNAGTMGGDDTACGKATKASVDPAEWAPAKGSRKAKSASPPASRHAAAGLSSSNGSSVCR